MASRGGPADSEPPVVRIVVLEPASEARGAASKGGHAEVQPDTAAALSRIGAEVEFDFVATIDDCIRLGSRRDVDLILVDRRGSETIERVVEGIAIDAPPIVAVIDPRDGDQAALEAFRRGAADCIAIGADYGDVLPVVALEQIRRFRQTRERLSAKRRIDWLERLHDAMISELPVCLVVLDPAGRVVEANPEFSRAFAVGSMDVRGVVLGEILPPGLVESGHLNELVENHGEAPGASGRLGRYRDDAGNVHTFEIRSRRLDEAGQILLALSDVSESELLAQRVGELEHYTDSIIHNMNSALLVVDLRGRVRFANATASEILGAPEDGLVGCALSEWFPESEGERSLIDRTLEAGTRFKGAETMITRSDGARVPIGISCSPLLDARRAINGAVAIFQDLSEIKQLERQVLQNEKMASIGQLAAGVAHEINNPTGFIHANLYQMSEYLQDLEPFWEEIDSLQKAVDSGDFEAATSSSRALSRIANEIDLEFVRTDFAKAVRESQEGSERIRHIVRDLRDFSHQDTAERLPADVNQCVDSTANIVWTMMRHSVTLEKEYQDLPQIRCYPMQLKQVFMNLLMNAYQSIEERIERSGEPGETGSIRICTAFRDGGVSVTISDTGIGIPRRNLARIFDPFFTTKEVGMGTGLGLSTSYGIIQRHGGTMRVESEEGVGATFEIWLPLEGGQAAGAVSSDGR